MAITVQLATTQTYLAVQWLGDNLEEMRELFPADRYAFQVSADGVLQVAAASNPSEIWFYIHLGEWRLLSDTGEQMWCYPERFQTEYKVVAPAPLPLPGHRHKRRVIMKED